tara:strand:- start:355 stop:528 length:174 start_codon:yes stop_codon:yes gene_type:complete
MINQTIFLIALSGYIASLSGIVFNGLNYKYCFLIMVICTLTIIGTGIVSVFKKELDI